MSKAKAKSYLKSRSDVRQVFEDLEAYHDFCRFNLRRFDPSELYRRDSHNYRAFVASLKNDPTVETPRFGYRRARK
jgi:hypothetical protein